MWQRTRHLPGVEDAVKLAAQRTTAAIAVAATAGISGLIWGAAPAFALPNPCGTGTLISGNICEQTFTSTTASDFTPPATTKLEALLVGGGGGGGVIPANAGTSSNGYATAGAGGQVKIVDFTSQAGSTTPLVVTVGAGGGIDGNGGTSTVTGGPAATASGGDSGSQTTGGSTGTNTGGSISDGATPTTYYGGGAGAGGSTTTIDGGDGVTLSTAYASDPLFGSDGACYGGGGAALQNPTVGTATCGGNAPDSDPSASAYPSLTANSGGGGAASLSVGVGDGGSDGVVVFRWVASYKLTFAADGHGTAPAAQAVPLGTAPTQPANPTASGFVFNGWYTDPGLTTPADFSVPLTGSTTFYAKWDPILATTGGGPNQDELPIALGTLTFGVGLFGVALFYRRKRKAV